MSDQKNNKNNGRRKFIKGSGALGASLGLGNVFVPIKGQSQTAGPDEEHFFLFVELKGGILWRIATDGWDIDKLPLQEKKAVWTMELQDTPPQRVQDLLDRSATLPEFPEPEAPFPENPPPQKTASSIPANEKPEDFDVRSMNGRFCLVPYVKDEDEVSEMEALRRSYTKGTTSIPGSQYRLGFAGQALKDYVDDIAVLRGVHMYADFHGRANNEMFSCDPDGKHHHIAGVVAHLLDQKFSGTGRDNLLLDNLVFEGAAYARGISSYAKAPIELTAASLSALISGTTDPLKFQQAGTIANTVAQMDELGPSKKKAFERYAEALNVAPELSQKLANLKDKLGSDYEELLLASLDLEKQTDLALTLMKEGLTRVATICLGTSNDLNNVDGFGLFDAHRELYHKNESGTFNTALHHVNVDKALTSLTMIIDRLKNETLGGKSLWEQTTVVVSSEFARPTNFYGNEGGNLTPGCGHYWYNNNYIFMGKGVQGGAWIGETDQVTQTGYKVKLSTLDQHDISKVAMRPHELNGTAIKDYHTKQQDSPTGERPFMARDAVKTVLALAGFTTSDQFNEAYPDADIADAKVVTPLVKK